MTPRGGVAATAREAAEIAANLGGRVVIKAQVLVGGRGKAGGIALADGPGEARDVAAAILGMEIHGIRVRKVLVDEAADIALEIYLGITNDRSANRSVIIASAGGGVDIEEVAVNVPENIIREVIDPFLGLREYQACNLASGIDLTPSLWKSFADTCRGLYKTFIESDATLAEINPLVVTAEGKLLALDGKMVLDDNALFLHPDLGEMAEMEDNSLAEANARQHGISYVSLDGEIGCMVNGAGLAMCTMDIIQLFGGKAANFLDIGGGASMEKVAAALRIILGDSKVKALLINIFGGITRCDDVARGIMAALDEVDVHVPIVVRLAGTNEKEGLQILQASDMITANSLSDAARRAVAAVRR